MNAPIERIVRRANGYDDGTGKHRRKARQQVLQPHAKIAARRVRVVRQKQLLHAPPL